MRSESEHRIIAVVALALLVLSQAAFAELPLPLTVKNGLAEARSAVPVTWGVPLSIEDGITDPGQLSLKRGDDTVAVQMTPMARWGGAPDDSTRPIAWLLIDVQADLPASGISRYQLVRATRVDDASPLKIVRDDAEGITLETGAATYTLSRADFRLFDTVALPGGPAFPGEGGIFYRGVRVARPAAISVEEAGPQRITLKVRGAIEGDLEYTAMVSFYAGLAEAKIDFRAENFSAYTWSDDQPICNDYGTAGSVRFDDLSLSFAGYGPNNYTYPSGEGGSGSDVVGTYSSSLALVQESSGDENWNALLSEAPRLQSGVRKRPSTVALDGAEADGPNRLGGWLDSGGVTVAVPGLWQNFPKALRARGGRVEVGLFPGEFSMDHELRSGEFKTHTIWVRHHGDPCTCTASRARSALSAVRLDAPVEAVSSSMAAGLFGPRSREVFPDYEFGVDYQIVESPRYSERPWESAAATIQGSISASQTLGWVDYGDAPTDFEPFRDWVGPPYNLKYEAARGIIFQALRTGDEAWWEMAGAAARHAGDIDILHSRKRGRTAQRAWPDGGMYGHGYHDERGNTNPHRNFMNPSVSMTGAPPGMFLWAWLSGDLLALDSALEVTENVYWRTVNSSYPEDGGCAAKLRQCSLEPWTCDGWEEADGGRVGGNAVKAFLAAYIATGDNEYLDVVGRIAGFVKCQDDRLGYCCNRYHMQTTFNHNIGHYLLLRKRLGLQEDATAASLLRNRIGYELGHLWNAGAGTYSMCYTCDGDPDPDDCDESFMCSITDNWLLSAADSFGVASIALDDASLLEIGRRLVLAGTPHPMGQDSTLAYHFSKEFVNAVGYGNMFMYAWRQAHSGCSLACTASAVPASGTAPLSVSFSASAQTSGCSGSPSFSWSFGDGAISAEQNPAHTYATAGTYNWSLNVTVEGQSCSKSGTAAVLPPGAQVPGDCDGSGTVSIGEVQRAINMFLGGAAPDCGVDCEGNGQISIGEVQKVINGFLGLASSC